jgi:PST family polysaccharide transporter
MVIGQFLCPVWVFQGLETMKYITYVNLITKALFTLSIFIFVQTKSDYLYVPLLTGIGAILSGAWTLYFIRRKFSIQFSMQPYNIIKEQLIDGWHIFLSTIVMSLYTVSTTFILGLFASNTVVGYFAAANKVILAAKGLFTPIIQALYPMLTKKIKNDKVSAIKLISKVTIATAAYTLIISSGVLYFAKEIVDLLFGNHYTQSVVLLKIMAFLPFLIGLSNVFGLLVMLNFGFKKQFNVILTMSAILGIALSLHFVPIYESNASAIIIVVVEAFVTITMWLFLASKKLIKTN